MIPQLILECILKNLSYPNIFFRKIDGKKSFIFSKGPRGETGDGGAPGSPGSVGPRGIPGLPGRDVSILFFNYSRY